VFEDALVESLSLADEVVLAGVFKSESIPEDERLHPQAVAAKLQARNIPVRVSADAAAIVADLAPRLSGGDVVGILSNGGFGGIYTLLPAALKARGLR
jgi:UDP-N-acetylmuramate: L-alanyl-gamma-D-glutamyl-meso-diaminopimelate ligase